MKKIFTLIALVAMAFTINAQNFEKNYTYGFWSNWSAGFGAQLIKDFSGNWHFGEGTNIGFEIRGQKQIGQHWNMRLLGSIPGIFTSDQNQFDRYATVMVGFDWTLWRYMYVFADGGLALKRDSYGWVSLAADAGIGARFNICNNSTIYTELGLDCVADITTDMTYNNIFVKVGWMHNFGITETDRQILEQHQLLLYEKEKAVVNTDSLNNCLTEFQHNEKELIKRIEALENHDYVLTTKLSEMSHQNDSLASVIASIRENQLNYYALPFSVIFDNDSYTINQSEYAKIKAVASIMKNDTTIHYAVTGFCDKTGSQEYNQKLSERRAEAVKKALMKYGVKEEQITISGNGYEKPFSDGMLTVNRRVSFYRNF